MAVETIILGLIVLLVVIAIYYLNRINILSNRIDNAWAQIDVQLKKRADLVPNLIETVKGYMKHEKSVFKEVSDARKAMMGAQTPQDKAKAGNVLAGALKSIFALSENYPTLKANENFKMLQEELSGIENKIAYARQFFNDSVLEYNNLVTTIPGSYFAFGKSPKKFLEIEEVERKPVKVAF
ncbi:MAG: LemA family protein [Nanoarchaeota archaeon]|nr:LemA family protein [Nanoarchaeota archaeon]MBU4300930.1 LemA family protein [Nanoarchaeota archaeon]MBU4451525.1 LemA family protein [Nanoarchaeota archaeon]MCG2723276.1 LemA family protein [archaeon]